MRNRIQCVSVCVCAYVIIYIVLLIVLCHYNTYRRSTQGLHSTTENTFMPLSLKRFSISLKEDVNYVHSVMTACPDLPVPNVRLYNHNLWQPVSNSGQLFLYSAFIVGNEIRLIAIRQSTVGVLTCQIWYRNMSSNSVFVDIHAAIMDKISGGEKGHSFSTTYVVCPLSCPGVPFAVSIAEGNLTCQNANNSFLPQQSGQVNQGIFSVCVPPVYGTYPNPFNLVQWIETNRLLGVQFFTFYNAGINPNSVLWKVFEKYAQEQIIEILQWNIPIKDIHYIGQIASMHDCLYRNSKKFKYTGFFDLDELIIPRIPEDKTWPDMLKRLPEGCSYSFRSSFFNGNDKKVSSNNLNRDFIFNNSFVVTGVKRQNTIFQHSVRSKTLVKPEEIETFGVHITWTCKSDKVIRHVDPAIGMVHHYRFYTKNTDLSDNTTLKYMNGLRKQLENSPII